MTSFAINAFHYQRDVFDVSLGTEIKISFDITFSRYTLVCVEASLGTLHLIRCQHKKSLLEA